MSNKMAANTGRDSFFVEVNSRYKPWNDGQAPGVDKHGVALNSGRGPPIVIVEASLWQRPAAIHRP